MEYTQRGDLIMSDASEKRLMLIHALTSLHPGSGTALGVVDLPVQRERHTQWPIIPGSSLKGILRDACRNYFANKHKKSRKDADKDNEVSIAFGPDSNSDDKHAGAVSLTDARILAFPVRSLRGVFSWVTCAAVLNRLDRDLKLIGGMAGIGQVQVVENEKALCAEKSPLIVGKDELVLEEFKFTRTGSPQASLLGWISGNITEDTATRERIKSHLVILSNDDFNHFVRHATEVTARIGLNYDTKTAKQGALFYQEFLPPETIMYSVMIVEASRKSAVQKTAGEITKSVTDAVPAELQIGGDETIGKGICAVRFTNSGGTR